MYKSAIAVHKRGGQYLKDVIYGANDGIITTFAILAGVAGAHLGARVVFLLGLANLLADGFSMAASNYLGTKSEQEFFTKERGTESFEYDERPKEELAEMRTILLKRGYKEEDADGLLDLLFKNKDFWLDIMLKEELAISMPVHMQESAMKSSLATFVSFTGAGLIPLLPYFLFSGSGDGGLFMLVSMATAITLFVMGSLRSVFTGRNFVLAGLEMLFVGGVAATIAYTVGGLMSRLLA